MSENKMVAVWTLHGFGGAGAKCATCGNAADWVWAANQTAAAYGSGVCRECWETGKRPDQKTAVLTIEPNLEPPTASGVTDVSGTLG